jgi:PAS domain S-box-containing protein
MAPFIYFDADWRIVYANAAVERMDGVKRADVVGKKYSEAFPKVAGTDFDVELRRVMTDRVPARVETFFEPTLRWLEMEAHPADDGGVFFFRRDITEQKRAADEEIAKRKRALRESAQQREALLTSEREARAAAERANRTKDEFLAILSHELRTPIDNVLLWAQLLGSGKLDPVNVHAACAAIERSVRKQVRLIDDLLDVSRIASGKMRLEVTQVDVRTVLRSALEAAKPAAQAKGVALREVTVGTDFPFGADANRLEQVFANLLANAIKFTERGGEVEVRLERTSASIMVSVRDTGQGIDPEFLPYVFQRFRQADGSAARRHGGLGLGLAIVKELVELHGGTIRADSEGRGRGATFSVSLPLVDSDATRSERIGPSGDVDLGGTCVLIVEDESDTRAAIAQMLIGSHAEIETAASADEALEQLAAVRPRVLISDIGMPGKDGYELIREIRASREYEHLPAIALTAFSRDEDRLRALEAGYDKHLSKPVDSRELLKAVASLARRPH